MFVGHGLLAFAIVAVLGERLDWDRRVALQLAVLGGLFATLPDVDIVYAVVGLAAGAPAGLGPVESFWEVGNVVHRGVTHSLVVAAVTAAAVWLIARGQRTHSALGLATLGGLVAMVLTVSGALAGAITIVFVAGAFGLAWVARRRGLPAAPVAGAALVGLVSHPFGDLFTGAPPALLYPFDIALVSERIVLASDPTLHLLGAFGLELATAWLALGAYFALTERRPHAHVDRRAVLGVGYAGAALALPAPTLDVSYQFVFSVLAVGVIGVSPTPRDRIRTWRGAVTALTAVSLALAGYAAVYLMV